MDTQFIHDCMVNLKRGSVQTMSAKERIERLPFDIMGWGAEQVNRLLRHGYPEVLCCRGLDAMQVEERLAPLLGRLNYGLLCYGANRATYETVRKAAPLAVYHEDARAISVTPDLPLRNDRRVLIIGESPDDALVCAETAVTCGVLRLPVTRMDSLSGDGADCVTGYRTALREADIVLVVAGEDSVLASLLRRMTKRPVLAVTTSRGQATGSLAAMMAVAETCADGVTLCGTDNSYGAAWLAGAYAM